MGEEIRCGHRNLHSGFGKRLLEAKDLSITVCLAGPEGNQIIIMEGDAIRSTLCKLIDSPNRIDRRTCRCAKWIGRLPTNGPESKGELIGRLWREG
jgi:hypothetical protein